MFKSFFSNFFHFSACIFQKRTSNPEAGLSKITRKNGHVM